MSDTIPQDALVKGRWYRGEGRFAGDLGLWGGSEFYGFQFKHGGYYETCAVYGDKGFSPKEEINHV